MKKLDEKTIRPTARKVEAVADQSCRVEMFGGLRFVRSDLPEPVTRFALQKAGALLAYLALRRRPQPREQIIEIFWPDMDAKAARDNLSTTLGSLRRQIEPPGGGRSLVLTANHIQVGLNPAAVTTDVADFERLLDRAEALSDTAARTDLLQQAIALYQGDLLPGSYYDWSVSEMVRLQGRYAEALTSLCDALESRNDLAAAREVARRLVATDAYAEEAYIRLIRLQVGTGHVKEARETYRNATQLFEEEFGAPLAPATRHAIEELLARPTVSAVPAVAVPEVALLRSTNPPMPSPGRASAPLAARPASRPAPSLPVILSRFFGRGAELEQLAALLLPRKGVPDGPDVPEPQNRLVTLIGPGGNGKTRLALEFLRQASGRFGLWCGFVSLADLTSAIQIPDAIANALKIPLSPASSLSTLDQVADFLVACDGPATPSAILVLDNLEHLLPEEEALPATQGDVPRFVQTLLERAPGLAILCTSRQRLGLRGERLLPLAPLPIPEPSRTANAPADIALLLSVPSVRLYLDRAQATRPDFSLTVTNAPAVAALCRQLEGSPLAIELAAAWVQMLPPRKMQERLAQGLDIPEGGYADLPRRHRSLNAALEWSYRLLSPAAQRFFTRLSVFAGGWTLASATAIAGDQDEFQTLRFLSRLHEASLVSVRETGSDGSSGEVEEVRYQFLETVRVYARQRLEEQGEWQAIQRQHARYFLEFADRADAELRGPEQALWLSRLETDHDNLRSALTFFQAAEGEEDVEWAMQLAGSLLRFWRIRGHWREANQHLHALIARTANYTAPSATRARILNGAGALAHTQDDFAKARELYEAGLAIRRALGDRARISDSLHNLGMLALMQKDFDRARTCYEEVLAISRELGDTLGIADELHHLGWLAHEQGDLSRARSLYEESLAVRKPLGDRRGAAFTLQNLGNLFFAQGDLSRARALHEEDLAIRRELGDRKGLAIACDNIGRVLLQAGEYAGAQALHTEALTISEEIGDLPVLISALAHLAEVESVLQHTPRAVQIYGAAEALRTKVGFDEPEENEQYAEWIAQARNVIGDTTFARYWSAGESMTRAEVIAFALEKEEAGA